MTEGQHPTGTDVAARTSVDAAPEWPRVREGVPIRAPFGWLASGWGDLVASRFRGSFYGLAFALMGAAILGIWESQWQLTMGLVAGFFLLGPFVCAGIYELSRQLERGEGRNLPASMVCWRRNPGSIGFFAAILTFLMVVWARVSVVLFALASTTEYPTLRGMIGQILSPTNIEFVVLWTVVGFVFASLVFAISVVSVPLMLDRDTDTMMAIFSSARALATNPAPVYLWALLIVALIGGSLLLWFGLLLITAPLVGHATWHAYRALIEARI